MPVVLALPGSGRQSGSVLRSDGQPGPESLAFSQASVVTRGLWGSFLGVTPPLAPFSLRDCPATQIPTPPTPTDVAAVEGGGGDTQMCWRWEFGSQKMDSPFPGCARCPSLPGRTPHTQGCQGLGLGSLPQVPGGPHSGQGCHHPSLMLAVAIFWEVTVLKHGGQRVSGSGLESTSKWNLPFRKHSTFHLPASG